MALWLEGVITYQPAYVGDYPDEETADSVEVLAAVNRVGYVTTFSQPGMPLKDGGTQRAAVDGFCDEVMAERIGRALLLTDLVVVKQPPSTNSATQICVTVDDGEEFTWVGAPMDDENIDHYYTCDLNPTGLTALHKAWQVTIFDPCWGRNTLLWPAIRAAVVVGESASAS